MESARCKAFVTAAETGSFSKAGEVLGYTPSGVSQLVTSLERELGLPLLGRNRKGVTLTENGRRLLPAVREFLQQENRIYAKVLRTGETSSAAEAFGRRTFRQPSTICAKLGIP